MTPVCRATLADDDDGGGDHLCILAADHVDRNEDHECDCGAQWALS